MAAIIGHAVKNEPEDLTGVRRNSSPNSNSNDHHHHVVLSNSDISDTNFSPSTSSGPTHFSTGDFGSYEAASRAIYSTSSESTSYRSESEIYNSSGQNFVQRGSVSEVQYVQYNPYKSGSSTLSGANQIASPDSGIGESTNITGASQNESFEYPHADIINDMTNRKPWHEYGRQSEEKIHIDKIFSPYGFRYTLEAASSSSVRREDDKITYVNKGQFYGITLEYSHDPELPPLKSQTVKSIIMLVFREGKSAEEELKAWQFWHARQHSVKQRILDADTKNSVGLVGCIDEIAHNALAIYWNPLDSPAKVNIAVQCLSTDFSTQKGVKGLPLHLQIDTFEDPRDSHSVPVYNRGYYQIKVFCDKGAERKARDEERRAAKRRMSTNGKRRMEEMYHAATERSEFYSMADLSKPPILFSPSEDPEKSSVTGLEFGSELPSYFSTSRASPLSGSVGTPSIPQNSLTGGTSSGGHSPSSISTTHLLNKLNVVDDLGVEHQPPNPGQSPNSTLLVLPPEKRPKLIPPLSDRIMIYVRQETEDAYTPLHLIPPTVTGLIRAVETKYKINANNIRFLYRKSKGGILAKIDDDMLKYYCNEDVFLMLW
ncbi:protein grainyhead isoform X3 [Lepeophtheirus salmonis]|uniref:protein grainyhead isoform X3 n=1 Tax=Lepeophtheirus salmonis TaxID=72036 RepID=UPI003AF3479C